MDCLVHLGPLIRGDTGCPDNECHVVAGRHLDIADRGTRNGEIDQHVCLGLLQEHFGVFCLHDLNTKE